MAKRSLFGVAAVAFLLSASAQAATIPGSSSFDLTGSLVAGGGTFDQATSIDFGDNSSGSLVFGTGTGTITLGGFSNPVFTDAGFTTGTVGTVQDITNLSVGAPAIANFYSFTSGANTLVFNLDQITQINRTPANPANSVAATLAFYGVGTIMLTGYDPAAATFSFTTSNTGTGMTATFQSSAVTAAAAVPEPASWAMFIGGFGLLGATMRKRKPIVDFA